VESGSRQDNASSYQPPREKPNACANDPKPPRDTPPDSADATEVRPELLLS
jgi:hypothetical protein